MISILFVCVFEFMFADFDFNEDSDVMCDDVGVHDFDFVYDDSDFICVVYVGCILFQSAAREWTYEDLGLGLTRLDLP